MGEFQNVTFDDPETDISATLLGLVSSFGLSF